MSRRKLTLREWVFVLSLRYHGYRLVRSRENLKIRKGYIIPTTKREDADGIDFWIKLPKSRDIVPVQITQRGIVLFRKHRDPDEKQIESFMETSEDRIRKKRARCRKSGIAFVLIRDFDGKAPDNNIAWGDLKALKYGVARI